MPRTRRRRRAHTRASRRGRPFRRGRPPRAADRPRGIVGSLGTARRAPVARSRAQPAVPCRRARTASCRRTRAAVRHPRGDRAHRRRQEFEEFKARYGTTWSPASPILQGYPVGIVANNGILFAESALKGAHFIELCNQRGIPLVFLQNITGFMVGKKANRPASPKTARRWSRRSRVRTCRSSPWSIGGSFGAGNYAMCGRAYGARFLWMWPNARISVMGGEQARRCWRR